MLNKQYCLLRIDTSPYTLLSKPKVQVNILQIHQILI